MSFNGPKLRTVLILLSLGSMGACGPKHLLREYDFRGSTLAVDSDVPPYPDVLTGPMSVRTENPVTMVLDAATRAARELQVGRLEEKLDSASARVDMEGRLHEELLRRSSRYLGATAVDDERDGDFVMQVTVVEYGISATDWEATAYFFLDAEAVLIDAASGTEIWRTGVSGRDPLGPEVFSRSGNVRGAVTAAVLADVSVEDLERALEQLVDFTARWVTDVLREDLRDSRR